MPPAGLHVVAAQTRRVLEPLVKGAANETRTRGAIPSPTHATRAEKVGVLPGTMVASENHTTPSRTMMRYLATTLVALYRRRRRRPCKSEEHAEEAQGPDTGRRVPRRCRRHDIGCTRVVDHPGRRNHPPLLRSEVSQPPPRPPEEVPANGTASAGMAEEDGTVPRNVGARVCVASRWLSPGRVRCCTP